jgi:hypothetical protein
MKASSMLVQNMYSISLLNANGQSCDSSKSGKRKKSGVREVNCPTSASEKRLFQVFLRNSFVS